MAELREDEPVKVLPAPGGGWYFEIPTADGQLWGFRLTKRGAKRAAQQLLKGQTDDSKEA